MFHVPSKALLIDQSIVVSRLAADSTSGATVAFQCINPCWPNPASYASKSWRVWPPERMVYCPSC